MTLTEEYRKLVIITTNSSLCEIRTWPKPGNVHKTRNFPETTYQDFLTAAYQLNYEWENFIGDIDAEIHKKQPNFSKLYPRFVYSSIQKIMSIQNGGNVLLGHLLLLTPLFISAVCGLNNNFDEKDFWNFTMEIFTNSTAEESILLYKAIRLANPGGMGKIDKYDLNSENAFKELIKDEMDLFKIFEYSKDIDLISFELSTNYQFVRTKSIPQMSQLMKEYLTNDRLTHPIESYLNSMSSKLIKHEIMEKSEDFNELIVRLFLYILASRPDSLIIRKTNIEISRSVSNKSGTLYKDYYNLDHSKWFSNLMEFDNYLQSENGKLNPGTTADLLAASIYTKMLYKFLKF